MADECLVRMESAGAGTGRCGPASLGLSHDGRPCCAAHRGHGDLLRGGARPGRAGRPMGPGRRRARALRQHRPAPEHPARPFGRAFLSAGRGSVRGGPATSSRRTASSAARRGSSSTRRRPMTTSSSSTASATRRPASPHWPYRYAVQLRSSFGAQLEVSLTTTNLAEEPFDYEEALHAYLVVGDIRSARVSGLDGKPFYDKVTKARARPVRGRDVLRRDGCRVPHGRSGDPSRPGAGPPPRRSDDRSRQCRRLEPLVRQGQGGRRHRGRRLDAVRVHRGSQRPRQRRVTRARRGAHDELPPVRWRSL